MTPKHCAECGDELVGNDEPYSGENGEPLCEICYAESLIECCECGESVPEWCVGRVGNLLAVTEQCDRIAPGVYRITQHPYHWSNYLSGGLYADAISRIGDLTEFMYVAGGYPVGHICGKCATTFQAYANGAEMRVFD